MRGTVQWYDGHRQYGFIRGENGGDYMVRREEIIKSGLHRLDKGQIVEFTTSEIKGRVGVSTVTVLRTTTTDKQVYGLFKRGSATR